MNQIKIPKEVMELLYEAAACKILAEAHNKGWFPSLKAVTFSAKGQKAGNLAHRAINQMYPSTAVGIWNIDMVQGVIVKVEPEGAKPKAARKRKIVPPVAPAFIPTTKGETK